MRLKNAYSKLSNYSEHLGALEEAAHFYDVMVPDRSKALMYAQRYIQIAGKIVAEMQTIIDESD